MGHDITAYRPEFSSKEARDRARERHRIDEYDDTWLARYRQYEDEIQVAYNRRNAGNPLNQVLYLALGVMDEAYAGCSGNGSELDITLEQFESAKQILETKNFAGMSRDRNMVDDIMSMLAAGGATISRHTQEWDVSQEREFVDRCITLLKEHNVEKLVVDFG